MTENEGGEYPGREAYDEVEAQAEKARKDISPDKPFGEVKEAVQRGEAAEERLGGMREMAFDEALKLNEEYDRLWGQKDQAEQALADFRREKLGMKEPESKAELPLEEQARIYAEMFGADAGQILERAKTLQADMTEQERKELTMLIYAPEGIDPAEAWQIVKGENPTYNSTDPAKIKTKGETGKAIIAFARYSQEPDEDSLGERAKSAEDWEATGQHFMSPKLRMIAGEFYRRAHGKQLDEKNWTLCPGSRAEKGEVPGLYFFSSTGEVRLDWSDPGRRSPGLGVRQVVFKES